jgi:hypothetical protein
MTAVLRENPKKVVSVYYITDALMQADKQLNNGLFCLYETASAKQAAAMTTAKILKKFASKIRLLFSNTEGSYDPDVMEMKAVCQRNSKNGATIASMRKQRSTGDAEYLFT